MKKRGHVGPTQIKKKKKNKKRRKRTDEKETFLFLFLFFFSLTSLFDLRKSDYQNSSGQEAKGSTRRGLRVGTKNMGFR